MKHYVDVPAEQHLFFPPFCPFTGADPAETTIRILQTRNGIILPIPSFGFIQSYTETSLDIPVSAKVRATAARLRLFTWVCLLGGITAAMLSVLKTVPWLRGSEAGLLFGGITLACVFSVARWWMLRKVCIIRSLNNFIRVRFHNQEYARQFSQMNRLLCESR